VSHERTDQTYTRNEFVERLFTSSLNQLWDMYQEYGQKLLDTNNAVKEKNYSEDIAVIKAVGQYLYRDEWRQKVRGGLR